MNYFRWHLLAFLLIVLLAADAALVLYELPGYEGQSLAVAPSDNPSDVLTQWSRPVSSIGLDPRMELITTDRDGMNATWHHSTLLLGSWTNRITSFRLRPSTTFNDLTSNDSASSWRSIGTPDGYLSVRTASSGLPECLSSDGVNCTTATNVADLLTRPPTIYPAQCGAAHTSYWGTSGFENATSWCALAHAALTSSRPTLAWTCVQRRTQWIAVTSEELCIRAGDACSEFADEALCAAAAASIVGSPNEFWVLSVTTKPKSFRTAPTANKSGWVWGFGVFVATATGGIILVAVVWSRRRKPDDLEATYCSSVGEDSDSNEL
ncbi:hypothetical protein ACHHYP_13013 [Achlya hypogyna]|uniref:Secreted protein n=1 Tax=Achlya hypogyna TaxID=1202772 RepID=A0A1V9YG63_ACHHY|nr:hypothetical protein ACHHYP_13013 [Achlya hypogyna]